jgi:hypothetical protein
MRDQYKRNVLLEMVATETDRQDERWGWPREWVDTRNGFSARRLIDAESVARDELAGGRVSWDAILAEEAGEQARETDPQKRIGELVQLAAVALSAAQDIWERSTEKPDQGASEAEWRAWWRKRIDPGELHRVEDPE